MWITKRRITDEKNGISYTLHGNYYLPDLAFSSKEKHPIGVWVSGGIFSEKVTGQLKAENQMPWVGKMNAIREARTEFVNNDLIYV